MKTPSIPVLDVRIPPNLGAFLSSFIRSPVSKQPTSNVSAVRSSPPPRCCSSRYDNYPYPLSTLTVRQQNPGEVSYLLERLGQLPLHLTKSTRPSACVLSLSYPASSSRICWRTGTFSSFASLFHIVLELVTFSEDNGDCQIKSPSSLIIGCGINFLLIVRPVPLITHYAGTK
ncbi:hypothetical protein OUZ56_027049 [Daphnia magna]|uniref:Uncharacterized protein n=1 Tax=Daphnia magna TaxID=35525 RepID=A0ABQ9ZNN8_9CRUS|nr:hypothetical protein OUZ56_027049 [Daphnia magna]